MHCICGSQDDDESVWKEENKMECGPNTFCWKFQVRVLGCEIIYEKEFNLFSQSLRKIDLVFRQRVVDSGGCSGWVTVDRGASGQDGGDSGKNDEQGKLVISSNLCTSTALHLQRKIWVRC